MQFAITTPKLGCGEQVPKVLLDDAFIHSESRFVRRHQGTYQKVKGRLAALKDADGAQIACPKYVYAVTNVDVGQKKFTIAGNHASVIAAPVRINGSTGNDGLYTLVSATDVGATTEIVVSETPADSTADGNIFAGSTPVLKYHLHTKEGIGTQYLLVATAYHILLWSETAHTLEDKFTCTSPTDVERWSIVSFQDQVYATNGSDPVQLWDVHTSASEVFEPVEGGTGITVGTGVMLTKAKCLYAYQGYLFLGHTYEDGEWQPRRIRWCDADDPTQWDEDVAGDQGRKDLTDLEGFVVGFSEWSIYLIIACTKRMMRGWIVTEDTVFRWEREMIELGCAAPESMVKDRTGRLFFIASDMTVRELSSAQAIYKPIEDTIRGMNPGAVSKACGTYFDDVDRILWAIPSATADDNDLVVDYDPDSNGGDFYIHSIPVTAWGAYTRQASVTWHTLPFDTWHEWSWGKWHYAYAATDSALLLCGDPNGFHYEWESSNTDAGTTLTGKLAFGTSFGGGLHQYKRLGSGFDLIFHRDAGGSDVTVSARRDTEQVWTSLGTFSLADDDAPETVWIHVPSDLRGRHIAFKIEGTGIWEFLGAYFGDVSMDGMR